MFKNYMKIAFRNIVRSKGYSFINISGLAVGMAACILILLWVQDELSYDRFHQNANEIHRVVENQYYSGGDPFPVAVTPGPLAHELKEKFPEIVNSVRINFNREALRYEDKVFNERDIIFADPSIFEMFDIAFLEGNPQTALNDPHSIVFTEAMARKYFGSQEPIGKTLTIRGESDYTVTAIVKEFPSNSHLQFNSILPFELLKEHEGRNIDEWGTNSYYTYVQLEKGVAYTDVSEKIKGVIKEHNEGSVTEIYLQPLTRIHLYSGDTFAADIGGHGDILYVQIFMIIAIFVLFIACINFMNLATAKSANRAREVGMRKVVGANRSEIIRQFLGESILLSFIALLIAVGGVELLLSTFNNLAGKELSLNIADNLFMVLGLIVIAMITGIVSGSYPAFFLSSFKPVKVLKNTFSSNKKSSAFRQILVVVQFSLSIILIIGTVIIYNQLDYIQNKKLGLDKENIIYIPMTKGLTENIESLKTELTKNQNITSVSATSQLPTSIMGSSSGFDWEGKNPDDNILMHIVSVEEDYVDVFKMEMAQGRFYSKEFSSDSTLAVVINEEAAKLMGTESVVGKALKGWGYDFTIIGVVENFHFKPIRTKIEPLIMFSFDDWYSQLLIRVKPDDMPATLAYVEETYGKFAPDSPFDYKFLDAAYDRMYRAEERMGTIFQYFSLLAIFISCLGLFGLASFMAEKKTKEIGIRKVLGASVASLILLFSKQFTKWMIIANVIAWPVAYFVMKKWLENFAYRTSITWQVFIISGLMALFIALVTVSFQAIKVAIANPVNALKYE